MVFDDNRNKLVLFGGLGGPPFNDTWEFDPATIAWTQITPGGDLPAPRYRVEAAFASDLGTALFFGGETTDFTNDLLLLSATAPVGPQIASGGIKDVFSGAGGPFAPGEIVSIYGGSLGPSAGVISSFDPATATLPTVSGGVSFTANGIPAPLYYVSAGQLNVQIPYEIDGQTQASISVKYGSAASPTQVVQIAAIAPRLFSGIFNQDGSLNSADNPARTGDIIVFYATGQGVTNPPSVTGRPAVTTFPPPIAPVTVSIGGLGAEILFAGSAPATAGVMQVNARIPAGGESNAAVPVYLSVGGVLSQQGVKLAVR
jgi:uncharacterized protein (TIGR03437 family)